MASELTPKQQRFVEEYLIDLNGAQAAIRAGYSADTARQIAHENLCKPAIQDAVQKLMDERSKKTAITAEYVLSKIHETIERCSQAEEVMRFDPETKKMVPTGEWQFKEQGVLKGCELLGKHLKLFTDKIEHSGSIELAQTLAKARKRVQKP